jgi:hypothetical protein
VPERVRVKGLGTQEVAHVCAVQEFGVLLLAEFMAAICPVQGQKGEASLRSHLGYVPVELEDHSPHPLSFVVAKVKRTIIIRGGDEYGIADNDNLCINGAYGLQLAVDAVDSCLCFGDPVVDSRWRASIEVIDAVTEEEYTPLHDIRKVSIVSAYAQGNEADILAIGDQPSETIELW